MPPLLANIYYANNIQIPLQIGNYYANKNISQIFDCNLFSIKIVLRLINEQSTDNTLINKLRLNKNDTYWD